VGRSSPRPGQLPDGRQAGSNLGAATQELCSYSVAVAPGNVPKRRWFLSPDVCLAAAEEYIRDVAKGQVGGFALAYVTAHGLVR
jgi:hypothetical protein